MMEHKLILESTKPSTTKVQVIGAVFCALSVFIWYQLSFSPKTRYISDLTGYVTLFACLFALCFGMICIIIPMKNKSSFLNIYSDGVEGKTGTPKGQYFKGTSASSSFELTYALIKTVDLTSGQITLKTTCGDYTCIVNNGAELKQEIMSRVASCKASI